MGLSIEEQKAVDDFRAKVIEPSMTKLVILDFWAEWCGPCKQLTPVLEKVAADYADKGVLLIKINVDEERFIAAQFQIQSIPTVYALFQGQPVGNLTNARTETQLKQLLDQLIEKLPLKPGGDEGDGQPDIAPLIAMGEELLTGGEPDRAGSVFAQILDMSPDSREATAGLLRSLVAAERFDEAQAMLAQLPEDMAADPMFDQVRSALALAAERPDDAALAALAAAVERDGDDHQARYDYAHALAAAGQHDRAAEHLLTIIGSDKDWNDGAARAKLLQIFEAVGLEDPWVATTRRKLSAALFG